jgi:hypothetical protein
VSIGRGSFWPFATRDFVSETVAVTKTFWQINCKIAARFIHYSSGIASTIYNSTLPRQFNGLHDKDPARSQFATRDFVSEPSRLRRHFGHAAPG